MNNWCTKTGTWAVLAGLALTAPAFACPPEQVAALEAALSAAPPAPPAEDAPPADAEAVSPGDRPNAPDRAEPAGRSTVQRANEDRSDRPNAPDRAEPAERWCGIDQALAVRRVLGACQPRSDQSLLWLGAGRCLQQAGLVGEATAAYHRFLAAPADAAASPARVRDRRQRVRRWLMQLGEEEPASATLVLRSNLRGARVHHLSGYPDGVTIPAGEVRMQQPPGSRVLSLSLPGFQRVELPVDLVDASDTVAAVDWRQHLTPRYASLALRWDDFQRSGLTPAGYQERGRRPLPIAAGVLLMGAGAALIAVCATNTGEVCDASWKQGLMYGAGAVVATGGLLTSLSALFTQAEQLPPAGLR